MTIVKSTSTGGMLTAIWLCIETKGVEGPSNFGNSILSEVVRGVAGVVTVVTRGVVSVRLFIKTSEGDG